MTGNEHRTARLLMTLLWLGMAAGAAADEVPELAMPGGRARAMSGAFTAVADDLSAVFWNPAGLALQERPALQADLQLMFGGDDVTSQVSTFPTPTGDLAVFGLTSDQVLKSTFYLVGGAAPAPWQPGPVHVVVGASFRRLIDLLFLQEQVLSIDPGGGFALPIERVEEGRGGVNAATLSAAADLFSRVQVGANLNLLTGTPESIDEQRVEIGGLTAFRAATIDRQVMGGWSFELGVRARILEQLTIGAVLRPGYDIDSDNASRRQIVVDPSGQGTGVPSVTDITSPLNDTTLEVPTFFGVGAALRPWPALLIAADYQHRPWDEARFFADVDGSRVEVDAPLYETHSVHFGGEYTTSIGGVEVPFRGGFRTVPTVRAEVDSLSAAVSSTGFRTYRGKRVEGNGWSIGTGLHFRTVHFDVAFERVNRTLVDHVFEEEPPPGLPVQAVEINQNLTSLYFTSTIFY